MMKKVLGMMLAMALLVWATASLAEQRPSPTMQTEIKASVTTLENSTAGADFEVWLNADTEAASSLLTAIQEFVKTEKIAYFFDEETWTLAAEYLPENFDKEDLMLAEVYSMSAVRYVSEYGDADAAFEFASDYEDDAILLGMVGVVVNELADGENLPDILWTPIRSAIGEGCVILTLPQAVLEQISAGESAYFVLLQAQA